MKEPKKCAKCGKMLRSHNKSGLCEYHNLLRLKTLKVRERKAQHLCIECGNKVTSKIIWPVRCEKCSLRQKENKIKSKERKEKGL